jgi:hypothetical protein
VKKNFGGSEYASDSCLNAVSTIQNTGKKNPSAAIHASTPQAFILRGLRFRTPVVAPGDFRVVSDVCGPVAVVLMPPPPYR